MSTQEIQGWNWNLLLGGGVLLAGLAIVADLSQFKAPTSATNVCAETVNAKTSLSQQQFAKFLTIPERHQKQQVRSIVQDPYCRLPKLEVRSGVKAEREAYPLAFNPHTQLVILYEGDEYAGFTIGPR